MAERLADAVMDGGNPSNSAARADMIRAAVRWIAEQEAEVKALNAEIAEYKQKYVKGDLGFKIADWNAIYRVSQLSAEDRDVLLDTIREGFAALGISAGLEDDVVNAMGAMPARGEPSKRRGRPPGSKNRARSNGGIDPVAAPNTEARAAGRRDGLGGVIDHAARYPQGEPGHADYMLGVADGEAERARIMALGNGAAEAPEAPPEPEEEQGELDPAA